MLMLINDNVLVELKSKASFVCVSARYASHHRKWLPMQNALDSPWRGCWLLFLYSV
jgi:hypothetical protein